MIRNTRMILRFVWRHMTRSWGKSLLTAALAAVFLFFFCRSPKPRGIGVLLRGLLFGMGRGGPAL